MTNTHSNVTQTSDRKPVGPPVGNITSVTMCLHAACVEAHSSEIKLPDGENITLVLHSVTDINKICFDAQHLHNQHGEFTQMFESNQRF